MVAAMVDAGRRIIMFDGPGQGGALEDYGRVTGDVLLLAGADDHFVPLRQLARQAANLSRARSVTTRTFTAAEHASNHCQVGNVGLAARVMIGWLDQTESANRAETHSGQSRSHGASSPIFL